MCSWTFCLGNTNIETVFKFVCLWIDGSVTTIQDAVLKLYWCIAEIKMKAEFKNACDPSKGAQAGRKWGN